MKHLLISLYVSSVFFISSTTFLAAETTESHFRQCIQDIQSSFIDYNRIVQSLTLNAIPQSQWQPIYSKLKYNIHSLNARMRSAASSLRPNPLSPYDHNSAIDLLKNELRIIVGESVNRTLGSSDFANKAATDNIVAYILSIQKPEVQLCLTKEVAAPTEVIVEPPKSPVINESNRWNSNSSSNTRGDQKDDSLPTR